MTVIYFFPVFTSSQRRLLSVVSSHKEDKSPMQSQHDDNLVQLGNVHGAINKPKLCGSDVVWRNIRIIGHVLVACYCFWMLAIICDEYFLASIHVFCDSM